MPRRCLGCRRGIFCLDGLSPIAAAAEDDVLQQAINYVFTGTIDPKDAPEITDRKSCVVVVPDPKWKRFIRYYLTRLGLDDPRIDSTYSGRQARYQLDAESDQDRRGVSEPRQKDGRQRLQIRANSVARRYRSNEKSASAYCRALQSDDDQPKLPF